MLLLEYLWATSQEEQYLHIGNVELASFVLIGPEPRRLVDSVIEWYQPFLDHYLWNHSMPSLQIHNHNSLEYVYGQLEGDSNEDQNVFYRLIIEFTHHHPCHVHLWHTTDREIVAVLTNGTLGDDTSLENRVWVTNGEAVVTKLHPDAPKHLLLAQAVAQVRNHDYSDAVAINDQLNQIPGWSLYHLADIADIALKLPLAVAALVSRQPWIVGRAVGEVKDKQRQLLADDAWPQVVVSVPGRATIDARIEAIRSGTDFSTIMASTLMHGIKAMIQRQLLQWDDHLEVMAPITSKQALQHKLISSHRLDAEVPDQMPQLDANNPQPNSDEMERLWGKYFQEESIKEALENDLLGEEDDDDEEEERQDYPNSNEILESLGAHLGKDGQFLDFVDFLREQEGFGDVGGTNDDAEVGGSATVASFSHYNDDSDYQSDLSEECVVYDDEPAKAKTKYAYVSGPGSDGDGTDDEQYEINDDGVDYATYRMEQVLSLLEADGSTNATSRRLKETLENKINSNKR